MDHLVGKAAALLSERSVFVPDDHTVGYHIEMAFALWEAGLRESARIEISLAARRLEGTIAGRSNARTRHG